MEGRRLGSRERRLDVVVHRAYHAMIGTDLDGVAVPMAYTDGRLRELFVTRLDLARAVEEIERGPKTRATEALQAVCLHRDSCSASAFYRLVKRWRMPRRSVRRHLDLGWGAVLVAFLSTSQGPSRHLR